MPDAESVLRAFSRWVFETYFEPESGYNVLTCDGEYIDYGKCTVINHVFFEIFGEDQVRLVGFDDMCETGTISQALWTGHDFALIDVGGQEVIGDVWAYDYFGHPPFGRLGRGRYPSKDDLVDMNMTASWRKQTAEDWRRFCQHFQL
jgi:hypothetical protein